MKMHIMIVSVLAAVSCAAAGQPDQALQRAAKVARTPGLIAFWRFAPVEEGTWVSLHDPAAVDRGYPAMLRRIGDPKSYTPAQWPYHDEQSALRFVDGGPFGQAVHFDQGRIFAEVPRRLFDRQTLDITGRQAFTMIAWTRFTGHRHMIAGIWDEGGWNKYGGRRQVALFGGLFGSRGVIGHISTTGASSYPQSTINGSQYARCRAIDGSRFDNNQWVAVAMTFDPDTSLLTMCRDGRMTPTRINDPVEHDVYADRDDVPSNPYRFDWRIWSPRDFTLKFNGYNVRTGGVYEHWLRVDLDAGRVTYNRAAPNDVNITDRFRVSFDVLRGGKSLVNQPIVFDAEPGRHVTLPDDVSAAPGDVIVASLEKREGDAWQSVGEPIRYTLREGAPFTFGRALGLGDEPIDHGAQLDLAGVAVFNRVLSADELRRLSFVED
jgi:hypothetical protein